MMQIIFWIFIVVVLILGAMLMRAIGNFVYHMLLHDMFRIPFVVISLFFVFVIAISNKFSTILGLTYGFALIGFYSYFFEKFYYTYKNFFQFLINIGKSIFKIGSHTSRFLMNVKEGVYQDKWTLHQERKEFENEKAWFEDEKRKLQEENEKIMRAWEELFKAREEFERHQSGGSSSEKQDHSQHKSYQEQKKQYEESKRKEHKQKTGRLFQEWAKFDLENPAHNKAHEVLGTSPNSTPSEIKKAYYALAKKWMPDTLKHWAKTTEEIEEGLKIAQMINIAYEKIGKGR